MAENDSRGALVTLIGAFDLAQRSKVSGAFHTVVDEPIVALDLERTTYIDSIALGCIIRLHTDLSERGAHLFITNASPVVKRILDVTGLSALFQGPSQFEALLTDRGIETNTLRHLEVFSDSDE
jgi:anti-anti-sigma factor